jgi:hypothetical protein
VCSFLSALLRGRGAALAAAQGVQRRIDRDAIQPREEVCTAIKRRQSLERADERFLSRVVGIAVVAENMECCSVHASLVASYETTESFAVTIASPIEVGVRLTH